MVIIYFTNSKNNGGYIRMKELMYALKRLVSKRREISLIFQNIIYFSFQHL